ncbi:MAG: hypothetical protein VX424_08660 [Actinomycetota bacterium]|nr:hypothetical protein [Actinomycetota bacterium]
MNDTSKVYARRHIERHNGREVTVTRLETPLADQRAIESGKSKGWQQF